MASGPYPRIFQHLFFGNVNIASDSFGVLLVNNTFSWNESHQFVSDLSGEVSDASYSRQTLAGVVVNQQVTEDKMVLDANDPVFTGLDVVAPIAAVFYVDKPGADSVKLLVSVMDTNNLTANGGDVTLTLPTDGFFHMPYTDPLSVS